MKKLLLGGVVIALILSSCKSAEITGGNIYIQNKKYDKAIEQFKLAVQKHPEDPGPYVSLSVPYFLERNYKEAVDALNKAFQLDKKGAEDQVKIYESFLGIKNYKMQVFYNGSITYLGDGNFEKALELVKGAEDIKDPESESLLYNLHGNILIRMNKGEEAPEFYEKAIEVFPENIDPYLSLGKYYTIENKPEKAISYFEKALAIDSTATDVYTWLGQAYLSVEDYTKAIDILEKASVILKDNSKILYNLALSYFKNKNYDAAIENSERVINLEETDPEILSRTYNLLGQIYITKEQYEKAINALQEAIQKNPNDCEAYHLMAYGYYKMGKKNLSSEYANKWNECLEK